MKLGRVTVRCLFFTSASGCKRGAACAFCHHLVPQAAISRPRKVKRDAMRTRIVSLLEQLDVEKQQPQDTVGHHGTPWDTVGHRAIQLLLSC